MKKRIFSLLLAFALSITLSVVPAFAYETSVDWVSASQPSSGTETIASSDSYYESGTTQTVYLYPAGTEFSFAADSTYVTDLSTGKQVPTSNNSFTLPADDTVYRFDYEDMANMWYWHYYVKANGESSTTPTKPDDPFAGAERPSDWAADQVAAGIELNIVPDTLQSQYEQATTRAEFCALATRLYETVKGEEITVRETFTDTTDENVEKMAALKVVNGTGDGIFEPNASLTREQAATILSRLATAIGQQLPAGSANFADNGKISDWAIDAVGQMQAANIMNGIENNQFDPAGDYTREQSIVTIMRMYDYIK